MALKGARWADVSHVNGRSIGQKYLHIVDVILVDTAAFSQTAFVKGAHGWTRRGLLDRGFLSVSRPTVLLALAEQERYHILALFLTGTEVEGLSGLSRKFPQLHETLIGRMNPIRLRPKLCMIGYRWNRWGSSSNLPTGYHCTTTLKHAVSLWRDSVAKALVVSVATRMCDVERDVSPVMARHRAQHAVDSAHPGILPGISTLSCPAHALGISKGYVSDAHSDASAKGMVEMIVWNSDSLKKKAGYTFAIVDAGVIFELRSDSGAAMCMVQGSVRHGTPRLDPSFRGLHCGFGAVVINKENLLSEKAVAGTKRVRERTSNPFISSFARADRQCHAKRHCRECIRSYGAVMECAECNKAFHPMCAAVTASSKVGLRLCPACLPLVEAAGPMPVPQVTEVTEVGWLQRCISRVVRILKVICRL